MEDVFPLVIGLLQNDPVKAIAVILILICGVLFFTLNRRIEKDLNRFDDRFETFDSKMNVWESSIHRHMLDTGKQLIIHSENMGKATKAINGDFLRVHEAFLQMKEVTSTEIEKLKNVCGALERSFLLIAQKCDLSVEKIDEKFGRIIELKKNIDTLNGKVLRMEESTGQDHGKVLMQDKAFDDVKSILASHKAVLEQLQREVGKLKK